MPMTKKQRKDVQSMFGDIDKKGQYITRKNGKSY